MPRVYAKRSCACLLTASLLLLTFLTWPPIPVSINHPPTTAFSVQSPNAERSDYVEVTESNGAEVLLPWFMGGGSVTPTAGPAGHRSRLWPAQRPGDDRITAQLMFKPAVVTPNRLKTILMYNGLGSWAPAKTGRSVFSHCPVNTCTLTSNKAESNKADAILYRDHFVHPGHHRSSRQVWILYMLECPYHTQHMKYNDVFNWTATYRRDSDIVAPYEKWVYYDDRVRQLARPLRNYAANKTRQVAWFVSNCGARNGRLHYAKELQKYIGVDIFGSCGTKKCPRTNQALCFSMLDNEYKFYLAFENSNCKDYITEKFFVNGLGRDILPIVMGARPEDYEKSAPKNSYIHVDDFDSPKELANYLHMLDKDDELYNSYFRWKGTGEFINTHFFCRLCALLHDDFPIKSYRNINEWWRGRGICTSGSWRKQGTNWAIEIAKNDNQ
ncbi:glycoprotein 3-alpha-L-fucosyltransferase A [Cimex lectularius]|uniref:Fucosyltransferase n=1 Tax=Cimex lectularius TaxID=79782 RepID=A0A8I6RVJ9_CIMLE|nr:glycoprotein 3-alpha-L-fucosyltransferase A [Cimex lectularius]XP_014252195.1 glycoprotein 3-alpha-L-fucosyltransferase A [Cimex lectularius]XP_014252196.1 glycoprotein 3-alpha-L-fucosyltransferase A [Cimex lectularius]XP_014252197.1 glycoprotein 3-alpha-L-fucosyltransferase A [Cimex lectularius]XP_024086245.1 glycoprotein 3-alpha-L-fucosyltransferase A [Cimex lectularius]